MNTTKEPRFAFVMEQTLGHVTHYKNMRSAIDAHDMIQAGWYPLHFAPRGTLETLPPLRNNWSARASWRAWRLLRQDHSSDKFDAIFFHTQVTTLLSVDLMRCVPTVVSLDATPINYDAVGHAYGHQTGHKAVEALKYQLNVRPLRAARALVTWCAWARQSLIDDYGIEASRITVIPPGVNLDRWPKPAPRPSGDPVRILFVGADFERKGGDVLLHAFRDGLDERCELHIVTRADISSTHDVHVYRDVAPNSDLLKRLYATADIFVLPTRADCFPLVFQEAMAAGLPIIATDVGAIAEAVRPGETGLLVPPGNTRALYAALAALIDNAEQRRAMGLQGRAFAEQAYDCVANARRILGIMSSLCEESKHAAITTG